MKMKQPTKRGKTIEITNIRAGKKSRNGALCRTNKHVNTSNNNTASTDNAINSHQVNTIANAIHIALSTSVVCDGLNMTVQLDQQERAQFQRRLRDYSGQISLKNASRMKQYRKGRFIYDGDTVIGILRFDPIGEHAGYVFLHVNPSKLDSNQSFLIQGLMSYLLGEPWCSIVGRAKISLFDAAVDIQGVNIASIIPIPSRAAQSGFFLKFFREGRTRLYKQGTEYVGHNKSEKNACVYDKADEQSELIGVEGKGETTRVEVQAKPRNRSRFSTEVSTFASLPCYPNPLRMLSFAEFQKETDGDDFLKLATVLTAYIGATAVLELVTSKQLKASIKDHFSAPPCPWWKPDEHWAEFLIGLATHPLFACCNLLAEPAYVALLSPVSQAAYLSGEGVSS